LNKAEERMPCCHAKDKGAESHPLNDAGEQVAYSLNHRNFLAPALVI
jgi:hypothetical protein